MDRIALFATILVFCSTSLLAASANTLAIESPKGGEVFVVGQSQVVRLEKTRYRQVRIELTRDGGKTFETLGEIDATDKERSHRDSLVFQVTGPASSVCRIRATASLRDVLVSGESNDFSIVTSLGGGGNSQPTGPAGGDLTGAYPNPLVAAKAVTSEKVGSGATSTDFLLASDGVGGAKWIAPATSAIPSGAAGGDLAGTYPNPTVSNLGAISGANLTSLNASNITAGTVPVGNLPIAGIAAGTRGTVYADNTSVFVAVDGKLSASGGAPSGAAGGDLSGTYPNPSLTIPITKTGSNSGPLLSLTNNGTGATASFSVSNNASAGPALLLQSNGNGYGVSVDHSGNNSAGFFRASNANSTSHALEVANGGRGSAGYFETTNALATSAALRVVNQGTGGAFTATNLGTGRAGRFHISNANNPDEALYVSNFGTGPGFQVDVANPLNSSAAITSTTNGSGRAIVASNSGTAETARFETSNSSNVNACLVAVTNGTGDAGFFRATNTSSGADAILAQMDGTGNAILTRHSGASGNHMVFQSGNPVFTTVARIDKDGKAYFNGLELNAALTVPTTTRYYSISSADFTTENISNLTLIRTDSQVSSSGSASNPVLRAGVHLPHGATITGFEAEVTDNDNNTSVTVSLVSSSSSLATLTSSGGVQNLSTVLSSVVDNQNNAYQVRATWGMAGSVVSLGKVTISYTITTPLP